MSVNIYAMTDTWNAIGTTFDSILMDVSNGAAGNPVGAAASQLFNLKTNGTQRFGVRSPHFANGTDVTPFLNLVDIWNTNGAVSGIKYNVTDTASAAGSFLLDLQKGGTSLFNVKKDGTVSISNATTTLVIDSNNITADRNGTFYVYNKNASGTLALGTTNSVYGLTIDSAGTVGFFNSLGTSYLKSDAANVLALVNSTNAQAFNIYNTSSSSNANYERLALKWSSNVAIIGTEAGGTGSSRTLQLLSATNLIQICGASSGFPAIKRNSANLEIRLADDSNYAGLQCAGIIANGDAVVGSSNRVRFGGSGGRVDLTSPADKVLKVADNAGGASIVQVQYFTVAGLPSAVTYTGSVALVSDATATTARSIVAGGGSNKVVVFSDGSNWLIVA